MRTLRCGAPRVLPALPAAHRCRARPRRAPPRREWAAREGWLPAADAPARFVFDGEPLPPAETPRDLDLEGGEIIEVHL